MRMYKQIAALAGFLLIVLPSFAEPQVSAKLISDGGAVSPGKSARVGVLFTVPEDAHLYWRNPGESGLPTAIAWTLPEGFEAAELQWPMPEAFYDDVLNETSFGYSTEVLLFTTVQAPKTLTAGDSVTIRAEAEWLVCLESGQCIPESASLELSLAVTETPSTSESDAVFEKYTLLVPGTVAASGLPITLTVGDAPEPRIVAAVSTPWLINLAHPFPRFFPNAGARWLMTDDNEGFEDTEEIVLVPPAGVDAPVGGALFLPLLNVDTGEQRNALLDVTVASETN